MYTAYYTGGDTGCFRPHDWGAFFNTKSENAHGVYVQKAICGGDGYIDAWDTLLSVKSGGFFRFHRHRRGWADSKQFTVNYFLSSYL